MSRLMEQQERVVQNIVAMIERRGWRLPALFLLEAGRPLALLGGQLLWIGQPLLGLFFPRSELAALADFLEKPGSFPHLITQLEKDKA